MINSLKLWFEKIKSFFDERKTYVKCELEVKDLEKDLSLLEDIHHGGCLYAAFAVYLFLKRSNLDTNFCIVQLDKAYGIDNHFNNKDYLKGNAKKVFAAHHFGYSFDQGQTIIDCFGIVNTEKYCYQLLIKENIEQFCQKAFITGDWNKTFDRNCLKSIEKKYNLKLL